MRVLVVGAGVIGSIYAGKLAIAGHEVELVARGKRLDELEKAGVTLYDEARTRTEQAPVRGVPAGDPGAPYDASIAALRRDQLEAALPELARLRGTKLFVTMTNGTDIGRVAGAVLGRERLLLGFPGAGGTRRQDGSVAFRIVPGIVQKTTIGEAAGGISPRVGDLVSVLSHAGFPSAASADMACWQRSHLALVCPIANALYLKGSLGALSADRAALGAMVDAIREGFRLVRAFGGRVEPGRLAKALALPRGLLAAAFGIGLRGEWCETVVARHAFSARSEMRLLNAELIDLGHAAHSPMPIFEELAANA